MQIIRCAESRNELTSYPPPLFPISPTVSVRFRQKMVDYAASMFMPQSTYYVRPETTNTLLDTANTATDITTTASECETISAAMRRLCMDSDAKEDMSCAELCKEESLARSEGPVAMYNDKRELSKLALLMMLRKTVRNFCDQKGCATSSQGCCDPYAPSSTAKSCCSSAPAPASAQVTAS